jgi:hypothetical protein
MDWTERIVAVLGLVGVIFATIWGQKHRSRADQAEAVITLHRDAFDFTRYTQEWGDTITAIRDLQAETTVDRFLLLVAFNGKRDPRWVSDILQVREADQIPVSYRHLEIDESYRDMLREAERTGGYYMHVEDMPESILRDIYITEGVTSSAVFHIETRTDDKSGAAAYTICSFATRNPEGLSENCLKQCRILAGRIKGLAAHYTVRGGGNLDATVI